MRLNTLRHGLGSARQRKRRGRGPGSGLGKTCGRGHKGQKSRSGGGVRRGFEGGQMPLHRRLPKFGFVSRKSSVSADVRVDTLSSLECSSVTVDVLRSAGIVKRKVKYVKLFGDGRLTRNFEVRGLGVTKGARVAIEAAGGRVKD